MARPAYSCADDSSALTVVADGPVLQCPTCGHRTDEPGDGVLGDGFDIVHRQWGTRGDPHAWRALRELVAATPTPTSPESARRAFVDGLRQVADVDVDTTDEKYAYRRHLDHGGMSGGNVNVEWWRTKGIPLLVDRAIGRRPSILAEPGGRPVRRVVASVVIWAIVLAIPAGLVTGGGWLIYQRYAGGHASRRPCSTATRPVTCGSSAPRSARSAWPSGRSTAGTVVWQLEGGNGDSDAGTDRQRHGARRHRVQPVARAATAADRARPPVPALARLRRQTPASTVEGRPRRRGRSAVCRERVGVAAGAYRSTSFDLYSLR